MKLQLSESVVADLAAKCPVASGDVVADANAVLDVLAAGGRSMVTRADVTHLLGKMGTVKVKEDPSVTGEEMAWALIGVTLKARCVPVKGKKGFWTIRPPTPSPDAVPGAADPTAPPEPVSEAKPSQATVKAPVSATPARRGSTKVKRGKV